MDQLHQQVKDLENRLKSYLDANNSAAAALKNEFHHLLQDVETHNSPGAIDARVVNMIRILRSDDDGITMNHGENDDLRDRLENLRSTLRGIH
jgi:hypothetical protein